MKHRDYVNARVLQCCALCGPAAVIIFGIGFVFLSGFFPPPPPTDSAQQIANIYTQHTTSIRLGCLVMMIGLGMVAPFGATIAIWTRRMENSPLLTYAQLVSLAVLVVILVWIPITWGVAAFRPDDTAPDITRAFNDYGWFFFLFSFPPVTVYGILIGAAILTDQSRPTVLPRWTGYLSLWFALLIIPAGMIIFTKTGPFAYNGVFAFYVPMFAFFIWIVAMTVAVLKAPSRIRENTAAGQEPTVHAEL